MGNKHEIAVADILPREAYGKIRQEQRRRMVAIKRNRRVEVGPFATFYFECYDTMWHQVQEMLFIEKSEAAQIPDELAAYNPLVPKGDELVATLMIEIDDPLRRSQILARLGGIENTASLGFAGETIKGEAEADQERTTPDGKTSSVQFVHFRFTPPQITAFKRIGVQVVLGLAHPNYGHMAVMPEAVRAELCRDFD
ncbi:MAG TPA: DUF3501 family protein [Alphaproteobacteria bacterium]|nr:DUF3501 family protein [Alphaproteobacteria bacterium]